jgi:glycosyltransferase involved in cell wall biosynthesis
MIQVAQICETLNVIYLGFVVQHETEMSLPLIDPLPAIQTHRFGLMLIKMLKEISSQVSGLCFVPIQNFPIGKAIFFRTKKFEIARCEITTLGFINVLIFKHMTRFLMLCMNLRKIASADVLLIHGLHLPNLLIGAIANFLHVKVGIVLTDMSGIGLKTDSHISKTLKKIDRRLSTILVQRADFVIALSPALAAICSAKQFVLTIPGIYDSNLEQRFSDIAWKKTEQKFKVLYFGGLDDDYGIELLIAALPLLHANVEIRIFGSGELSERLGMLSAVHSQLFFGGFVDKDRLIEEMAECDLLLNPRPSSTAMAEYSSPSKLLEYAASGRPILSTVLPSLGPELLDSLFLIENESPEGIASAINRISMMEKKSRQARGFKFRRQMQRECSVETIGEKILQHLKK